MSSAFSMLESIGYKISDASWLFASQNSSYQEVRVLDPAKSKALQIYKKCSGSNSYIDDYTAIR